MRYLVERHVTFSHVYSFDHGFTFTIPAFSSSALKSLLEDSESIAPNQVQALEFR